METKSCFQFGRATNIGTTLTIPPGDFSCIPVEMIRVTEAFYSSIDISVLHWMYSNQPGTGITLAIESVVMDHLDCDWTSGFRVSVSTAIMYSINAKANRLHTVSLIVIVVIMIYMENHVIY